MENIMVLDETMNDQVRGLPEATILPQLALMPLWNDYSTKLGGEGSGRQDEGLPSGFLSVLFSDDEDSEEEEDMDEDENFDDDFDEEDEDFDEEDEDFDDEDEDYEDEDEDYDYEEDVDYDDFDE